MNWKKTLTLNLTEGSGNLFQKQENYLGATTHNLILLKLYLYRDIQLSEQEIKEALSEINNDENKQEYGIASFPIIYQQLYKNKPFYLYSFNEYVSALFHIQLKKEKNLDCVADKKVGKKNRIYYIEKNILEDFVQVSKDTKLNQKTLLNFGFLMNYHNEKKVNLSEEKSNRIRKGVELTYYSLDKLDTIPKNQRLATINTVMKLIVDQFKID